MADRYYAGNDLATALEEEGLLPPHARLIELIVPNAGAVILRYEVLVERADLGKLARALQATADREGRQ